MGELGRKRRILLLSPDLGYGGAEKSMAKLSELLAEEGDVHFVVFNTLRASPYSIRGTLHSLDVPAGNNLFEKLRFFFQRVNRLRAVKRAIHPDVSISALEGADYVNLLSSVGERLVMSIRGSKRFDPNIRGFMGFIRHWVLIPWVYRRADHIVVAASGIGRELSEYYGLNVEGKLTLIPNFFDLPSVMRSAEESPGLWATYFSPKKSLIAVGRLAHEKGFIRLIEVFSLVKKQVPDTVLIIVGDGVDLEILTGQASRFGFKHTTDVSNPDPAADVVFTGYQANPHKFVARASLFVLSSFTEGFPNALVEAMSLGVPVVAADCPYGPAEILKDATSASCGVLLPVLHPEEKITIQWAETISRLLLSESDRQSIGRKGRERAEEYSALRALEGWRKAIGS